MCLYICLTDGVNPTENLPEVTFTFPVEVPHTSRQGHCNSQAEALTMCVLNVSVFA